MRLFVFAVFFTCWNLIYSAELRYPINVADVGWRLLEDSEFFGTSGRIILNADKTVSLKADFSRGGTIVRLGTDPRIMYMNGAEITLRTAAKTLRVDMRDSELRMFRTEIKLSGDALKWQTVCFLKSELKPVSKLDGAVLPVEPMQEMMLGITRKSLGQDKGDLTIKDFAWLKDSALRPLFPLPDSLFYNGGSSEFLKLKLDGEGEPDSPKLAYSFKDYDGKEYSCGTAVYNAVKRELEIKIPEKSGFYELILPAWDFICGIYVKPQEQTMKENSYFAIDFTSSWRTQTEAEMRSQIKIFRDAGILWFRERIAWREIEPDKGFFAFDARGGRYELLRKLIAEEGGNVLDVFHDTPAWNRQNFQSPSMPVQWFGMWGFYGNNPYPENLFEAVQSWSGILKHWPVIKALEVWNEPDIIFGNYLPPEYQTAFTRAVAMKLRAEKNPCQILGGVLAFTADGEGNLDRYRAWVEAGITDSPDIMSFHIYKQVADLEPLVKGMRQIEKETAPLSYGIPYWVTESGMPWRNQPLRAEANDDRFAASEIVGKAIEFKALGVKRYFPFKVNYGNEEYNNFGLFDRNLTPMRALVAYLYSARILGDMNYIGDLRLDGLGRSRVFSDGTNAVACLYRPLDRRYTYRHDELYPRKNLPRQIPLRLPESLKIERISGADGRDLSFSDGQLSMNDGIVYLHIKESDLGNLLERDTEAMKLYRLAASWKKAELSSMNPVIAQPSSDLTSIPHNIFGYQLIPEKAAEFSFVCNNFSDKTVKISLSADIPKGLKLTWNDSESFELAPASRRNIRFRLLSESVFNTGLLKIIDRNGNMMPLAMRFHSFARETLTIKQVPGDWIKLDTASAWNAAAYERADIDAQFRLSYSNDYILLDVSVSDIFHSCECLREQGWRGDSIQFAMQCRANEDNPGLTPYYEFGAALRKDAAAVFRYQPKKSAGLRKDIICEIIRDETEKATRYKLKIPASEIGRKEFRRGDIIAFSLVVNSNDGKQRSGALCWGDGVDGEKKPQNYNILYLK